MLIYIQKATINPSILILILFYLQLYLLGTLLEVSSQNSLNPFQVLDTMVFCFISGLFSGLSFMLIFMISIFIFITYCICFDKNVQKDQILDNIKRQSKSISHNLSIFLRCHICDIYSWHSG